MGTAIDWYLSNTPFRKLKQLLRESGGSTSMMFAVAAIPVFAAAGVAVDYNRVIQVQTELQDLADRAALTGAALGGTTAEKISAAQTLLSNEAAALYDVSYTANVSAPTSMDIKVEIDAEVDGLMMPAVLGAAAGEGVESNSDAASINMPVDATARNKTTTEKDMCLVALNTSVDNALYLRGTGDLTATGCGLFSNSGSVTSSLHFQGDVDATAEFFYAVGAWKKTGSSVTYNVEPESGKAAISDPLSPSITCPAALGNSVTPNGTSGSPTSLSDLVYDDITMGNNKYATFTPGTHYIKGKIDLKNGGVLMGTGVTLVLCGSDAYVNMNGGSLQLQAPTTGTLAGYAVAAHSSATTTSTLQGGPSTYIRGIWYTPKAKLNINGNATFNVDSKYFPIIVDQLETGGTGAINVANDATFYGFTKPAGLTIAGATTVYLID